MNAVYLGHSFVRRQTELCMENAGHIIDFLDDYHNELYSTRCANLLASEMCISNFLKTLYSISRNVNLVQDCIDRRSLVLGLNPSVVLLEIATIMTLFISHQLTTPKLFTWPSPYSASQQACWMINLPP